MISKVKPPALTILRISASRIADTMATQFQVWAGTPNAHDVIVDCCHSLATALDLTQKQRKKFIIQCRWLVDHHPE